MKISRFRPVVYIYSPHSGARQRNAENARRYCRFAVENGAIPLAPHLFLLRNAGCEGGVFLRHAHAERLSDAHADTISEASRNSTMSHFAGRVLKHFGDSEEAHHACMGRAAKCNPPLEGSKLKTIWRSAQGFYQCISKAEDYVPPEKWTPERGGAFKYDPDDRTDVEQARMLGRRFIRYDGSCWQETEPGARAVMHALTDLQLAEAEDALGTAMEKTAATGAKELVATQPRKKVEVMMDKAQTAAYRELLTAEAYRNFVLKRRESKYITNTLREAHPLLEIALGLPDKDWFLLCTPDEARKLLVIAPLRVARGTADRASKVGSPEGPDLRRRGGHRAGVPRRSHAGRPSAHHQPGEREVAGGGQRLAV